MARKKTAAKKKDKEPASGKMFFFVVLVAAVVLIFLGRMDFVAGIKGLMDEFVGGQVVESAKDLPAPGVQSSQTVRVQGIPDYKNPCSFKIRGLEFTCFRMIGFENRLVVCSPEGLKTPKGIDQLLKPVSARGHLIPLKGFPSEKEFRQLFKKTSKISLDDRVFVLAKDRISIRPYGKTIVLFGCLILGLFSLYRIIK